MIIPSTCLSQLLRLQRGEQPEDGGGWESFHARYHALILNWCCRHELSRSSAEDLTQEIWLKLLRDLPTYDPTRGRFRSWLKAVVNNALTDYWRRQQRHPEPGGVGGSVFLERLANLADPEATDELSVSLEEQANTRANEVFARVRARLHETTWQAFYQTLVEERSAKEVAQELGLTVAAVYKNTYRVKQMLHEEYLHAEPNEQGSVVPGRNEAEAISE